MKAIILTIKTKKNLNRVLDGSSMDENKQMDFSKNMRQLIREKNYRGKWLPNPKYI